MSGVLERVLLCSLPYGVRNAAIEQEEGPKRD